MSEYNANNGTYLAKLINEHGVKLRKFNDDVYDAFGEASEAVFETAKAHSPLAKKIHESFAAARKDVGQWMNLSDAAYYAQRNRVLGTL
jgi:TRAP-type mannitol/chloroaromatic compound transport system substrate-binding protein